MSKKPLIAVKANEMSGVNHEALSRIRAQRRDLTFIEGYSDVRAEIAQAIARGQKPAKYLKHRLQLIPITTPRSGKPDMQRVTEYVAMGYKALKFEDATGMGYTLPPHAVKMVDGGVMLGDTQVFYCDAETAEQHWQEGRQAIDEQTTDEATSQQLHSAGQGLEGVRDRTDLTTSSTEHRTEVTR